MNPRFPEYSMDCKIYDLKKEAVKEICLTVSLASFSLFYFYLPQNTVHNFGNMGLHVVFFMTGSIPLWRYGRLTSIW